MRESHSGGQPTPIITGFCYAGNDEATLILIGFLYFMLAALAFLETPARTSRTPQGESAVFAINLLESAVILAMAELRGWESGLMAFCFLLVFLIGGRPLASLAHKGIRQRGHTN
jgi:hypothetical protein